jgi:type III restriction enzyme
MKFQFESDLEYQQAAIAAVCDLFRGQEACRGEFTVAHGLDHAGQLGLLENDLGVGNLLTLPDDAILANLKEVQLRNGLLPAPSLESRDFTVEMETGTGKTYVYLRTIFELNQRYGFTKFAIVVPSIAIKEGVNKSLEMMGEHLRALYSSVPFDHFIYDSAKLGQVRNFATSPQIQIMVMTVGAINKRDINAIYQENEKTGGERPIDLVTATNPIVIVDEPQSVDGGLEGRGREALAAMNPLCTLRYSATHVDQHHMVYRLNAVDAYEQKLVKQIEVAAGTIVDDHNSPYVRLVSTQRRRGTISAQIEIDVATRGGRVQRQKVLVQDGDDLEQRTRRELYRNHYVGDIRVGRGNELLELRVPGDEHWLQMGEAYGGVDSGDVHRQMMRKVIQEHLEKEKRLRPQGIKVLSLFFIDKVADYRAYDEDGNPVKGEYALIFEEEYRRVIRDPDYRGSFEGIDIADAAERAHEGYFSIDRRGRVSDTSENRQADRDNAERAYNLIMRDKERLLSFEEPLQFIFSHSALREGWDNPNVFQICALRDIQTDLARRQTIGRGLRLCVNQDGERQRGFEINTLTVIAQESYEEFAENLQREIEEETGIRFGVVEEHQFALVNDESGQNGRMGVEKSKELQRYLVTKGYLDQEGKVTDFLKEALHNDALTLPDEFEPMREAVTETLRKATGRIEIKNAEERRAAQPREAVLNSEDFKALWERIKFQTTYRVHFDNDDLLKQCADALREAPLIPRPRMRWDTADVPIGQGGVQPRLLVSGAPVSLRSDDVELPDLLTELQNRTHLTRHSIARILSDSGRLDDFRVNPQKFIETAADAINHRKRSSLVDGIKYRRTGGEAYYAQELFTKMELTGYLKNMISSQKSVYDYVIWDSDNEAKFAEQMELNSAVKVYAKLPNWFKVPTPLGAYNPDWAVLIENEHDERLYFVAETKGTLFLDDLRNTERDKVLCGEAHFKALEVGQTPVKYRIVHTLDDLLANGLTGVSAAVPDRETFERLAEEWERDRPRGADVEQMTQHPAYQSIIEMGKPAVPWLLQRLSEKPDHWFVALNAITGARPVPSESRGRIKEMTQAWLNWGRQQGYELGNSKLD